jgi:hypothetical protein
MRGDPRRSGGGTVLAVERDMPRFLPLLALVAGCFSGPSVPEPDRCDPSTPVSVTDLEIGSMEPFAPWGDERRVFIDVGPQGSPMIGYRLRVQGAGSAGCLPQSATLVADDGRQVGLLSVPLALYDEGDGSRATDTNFMVVSSGRGGATFRVEAAGLTREVRLLFNDFMPPPPPMIELDVPPSVPYQECVTAVARSSRDTVELSVSDPSILQVVRDGPLYATFRVCGAGFGRADVIATVGDVEVRRPVEVVAPEIGPLVLAAGHTGVVELPLDLAGLPPSGRADLRVEPPELAAAPGTVTLVEGPPGSPGPRIRLRAGDLPGVGHLLVTAEGGGLRVALEVIASAPPAGAGDVEIEEVLYDVRADANCDGAVDAGDQFVEIANVTYGARSLDGVVVAGRSGTFARIPDGTVLGPGEVLVLFGSAPGSAPAGAWCDGIGTETAALTAILAGSEQPFDMSAETPELRGSGAELLFGASAPFPVSPGESCYLLYGGTPTVHRVAGGAADRPFSPGTRRDGSPFVDAELPAQ